MAKLFDANGIASAIFTNGAQLCEALQIGAGCLVLSEESVLTDSTELLACLAGQPAWSDLPIIVLARSGRESAALAEAVARLGNVSVMERPVRTSTLISLVKSSLRARDRQYQVRDLLESERSAHRETERASRIKDEFLATLSHELRTPLNAVLGWSQLLRKNHDSQSDVGKGLEIIERNARSQAQIIDDLLDMSAIISGKIRLDVQPVDVASVVRATIDSISPAAQAKGIRLQVVLNPDAGLVRGDPNRLQQVFWNLLTNAVKFTPKNGRILIVLARANSHLEVEVSDNGEGIDPSFQPHIFDRFRQADASITRRHGGLGLGLSIVKQLVELHGGTITAESAGRGSGSRFRVELPVMVTSASVQAAGAETQPQVESENGPGPERGNINLQGLKVLVVDDEPDTRLLLRQLLEDCNGTVITASSAEEALQVLTREAPDVLVSDIGMPAEDGYAFIRRVRALDDANANIPAIALTAYARPEDRSKAFHGGFQVHLAKPVATMELIAVVRNLGKRSA
ncbi:MAG TPA: ATP-binding protein [Burkholderiales bacterium]|nr:ATP-binding protein [Burkholderiales bacterium]